MDILDLPSRLNNFIPRKKNHFCYVFLKNQDKVVVAGGARLSFFYHNTHTETHTDLDLEVAPPPKKVFNCCVVITFMLC